MGGISRPGVVRGRRGVQDPGRQRTPPAPLHGICPVQRIGAFGPGPPGPGVEGGGGHRWSDVGSRRERGGDGAAGAPANRVEAFRAAGPGRPATARWSEVGTVRAVDGAAAAEAPFRERRSPGSRSRGFGESGAGRRAPQNGGEQRGDRGREPNGQRRGSSPARFSQRSSILRMKLPPSPVPGAVGPRPPPGPPPELPVPEEVPLGPVMA